MKNSHITEHYWRGRQDLFNKLDITDSVKRDYSTFIKKIEEFVFSKKNIYYGIFLSTV